MRMTKFAGTVAAAALVLLAAAPGRTREAATGSGEAKLTAALSREAAEVGGLVELTLAYRLPEGWRPADPLEVGGLEELTVIRREDRESSMGFTLLLDRLEKWEQEKVTLAVVDPEGGRHLLEAGPLALDVLTNLGERPEEAELRPLRGIVPIQPPWLRFLPWILAAAALVLVAAGLYLWLRRRRRRAAASPEDPPCLRARREIERLEAQGMFEKGRVKEFYFGLSEVMRRYLEAIRSFPAAEYTTEEIARSVHLAPDQRLLSFLRKADLVKFADDLPTAARKEEEVREVLDYIRETSPDAQEPEAAEAAAGSGR